MIKSGLNTYLIFYNITQKDLADATGINRNTIGRYCNNTFEKIDKNHLDLLCSFFKCSLDDIFEVDNTLEVKYPSLIVKNTIENYKVIKVSTPDNYDPISSMNPTELEEYTKSLREDQIRFNTELEVDELVSNFIGKIIKSYLSFFGNDDSIQQIFKGYDTYDYFTTELKVRKYYRLLHPFLSKYSKDVALLSSLVNIYNIYINGGLDKLSDSDLNDLKNVIDYYLINGLSINKKTR